VTRAGRPGGRRSNGMPAGRPSAGGRLALSIALLLLICAASALFGRYPEPGFTTPAQLASDPMAARVVTAVRLPRIAAAVLVGSVLGAAGCVFQLVFANPLVDAGFLGVSQGASFGAVVAMVAGGGFYALFGGALAAALAALALSMFLAGRIRFGGAVLRLVLSGIAVSAFFSAAVALVKYGADPLGELPDIMYWMMGGLSGASWSTLAMAGPVAAAAVAALVLLRWRTALLSLDEATATSLGARPRLERTVTLGLAGLGVAAVTAVAGPVAWVGLIVPHLARLVLRTDGSATVPGSAVLGAAFVVACDTVARGAFPGELPLGIVTALMGTVVFFVLLLSRRVRVERG